jgi:hypothetical protein
LTCPVFIVNDPFLTANGNVPEHSKAACYFRFAHVDNSQNSSITVTCLVIPVYGCLCADHVSL